MQYKYDLPADDLHCFIGFDDAGRACELRVVKEDGKNIYYHDKSAGPIDPDELRHNLKFAGLQTSSIETIIEKLA